MNLQFFRKHRKIFFVLMILAVFAMVTFGALDQLQQIFTRFRGDPAAKEIVMTIHGQDISRARYNEVQAYMHHVARQSDLQQWILSLLFHAETIGSRFGGGTGREGSATKAALILLVEAEQAGVALDEQLAEAQFDQLSPEDRSLLLRIFGGSREQTLIAARLEFTLQRYLDKVGEGAKILPEDVDEYFRRMYQTARITEVTVPSAKFVDQVGEPAAEAVQQQFDRYRDQLPEQSSEGFGYMVPDRVMIEWIYMDAEEVAATVKVTDTEIQAFYEENRESYVREPAAAPAGEAATPADAGATEAAPPATAPVEEPARQMNAPDAPATPAADGAAGENADNAPAAAPVAANQPEAIIQSENNQTQQIGRAHV